MLVFCGPHHFADVLSPTLWQWMLVDGGVVVAGGQLLWYSGLRGSSAAQITLASSFSPAIGVLAAYLILGEVPMRAEFLGGAIILTGIAVGVVGSMRAQRRAPARPKPRPAARYDRDLGFKGV